MIELSTKKGKRIKRKYDRNRMKEETILKTPDLVAPLLINQACRSVEGKEESS